MFVFSPFIQFQSLHFIAHFSIQRHQQKTDSQVVVLIEAKHFFPITDGFVVDTTFNPSSTSILEASYKACFKVQPKITFATLVNFLIF